MEDTEKRQEPGAEDEPSVYGAKKEEGGAWRFTRRGFLGLAAAAAAKAAFAGVPGAKSAPLRPIQLVAHATASSETSVAPGAHFTKIWYLRNNTARPWGEGATLRLAQAEEWQAASSIPLPKVPPGQVAAVRVPMVAPVKLGRRPLKATLQNGDEEYEVFLPLAFRSPEPPCTCDSDTPCTCDSDIPCTCDYDVPCTCDYDVPCTCDYYYCACDYEAPCPCIAYYCACDYEAPCPCIAYYCSCDYDCGCVGYQPCGCVYYF